MFRNITAITLVVALISFIAAPVTFAGQSVSADAVSVEAPAKASAAISGDAGLIDQLVSFLVGFFGKNWGGEDAATRSARPTDRGPSFDPDLV